VVLDKGRRAGVPSRIVPFKLAKMKCADLPSPCATGNEDVLVLLTWASRSLRSRCCCRDEDKARWRVDVDLSDGRLVSDGVERGRVFPLV